MSTEDVRMESRRPNYDIDPSFGLSFSHPHAYAALPKRHPGALARILSLGLAFGFP